MKSAHESLAVIVPNLRVRASGRVLSASIKGDRVVFTGGRQGQHSLAIDVSSLKRVLAHWEGYCENNGLRAVPAVGETVNFPRNGRNWSGVIVKSKLGGKTAVVRYQRANGSVADKRVDLVHITW